MKIIDWKMMLKALLKTVAPKKGKTKTDGGVSAHRHRVNPAADDSSGATLNATLSFGHECDASPEKRAKKRHASYSFCPSAPEFEPVNLSFEIVGQVDKKVRVESHGFGILSEVRGTASHDDTPVYDLDLTELSCTCKDYSDRSEQPRASPKRLCRHLVFALTKRKCLKGSGKWETAIIESGHSVPLRAWIVNLRTAPPVLVCWDSGVWLNVFAHNKRREEKIAEASGKITRFGWSLEEKRWSSGSGPPGGRELTPLMTAASQEQL